MKGKMKGNMKIKYPNASPQKTFNDVKVSDIFEYNNDAFSVTAMRIKPVTYMAVTYNAVEVETGTLVAISGNKPVVILNGEYVVESYD